MTNRPSSQSTTHPESFQRASVRDEEIARDADEPERTCRFCRGLQHLKVDGFHCVLCDPREGDLIGV